VHFRMELSEIYHGHNYVYEYTCTNEWMFCTVEPGIPPVPVDEILAPVDLIDVKLCTYSKCFCIILKKSIRNAPSHNIWKNSNEFNREF
jgi:hypothetical protein